MQIRVWLGVMAFALGLGLVVTLPAADKASPETIANLIEKLGSTDFADREKATKELEALGEQAIDALKKATKGDDLETKRRAEELLKKAEAKFFTKKTLEPTKLRFTFKDTPLPEAIAEVQKKTGLNITLNDPQNKLADRKVTLDTGETTLWEAVDLFVQKAGLVESVNFSEVIGPGVPPGNVRPPIRIQPIKVLPAVPAVPAVPVPPPPVNPVPQNDVAPGAIQVQGGAAPAAPPQVAPPVAGKRPPAFPAAMPNTLTLTDGHPQSLPTHYAGAVRIRALPPSTAIPGFAKPEGEVIVPLQVTPEPKMLLQSLVSVRIDKALDDQDQNLLQAMADAGGDNPGQADPAPRVLLAKAAFVGRPQAQAGIVAPVPVRFKKGDKASKTIKEMTGVVSMQLRTAPEALMTIEKLMEANGKEVKGENGGRIKVLDVSKNDNGLTLKIEFEQPMDAQGGVGNVPNGGIQILPFPPPPVPAPAPPQQQINGQVQVQVQIVPAAGRAAPFFPGGANGLAVQDEKGQTLPMNMTQSQASARPGAPILWQYTFNVPTPKDQGEPAKLVYTSTRLVTVDVPFTLKDVPVQ